MKILKTTLIIVRHAEAQGNFERFFQGWTDGLLTEKGHLQAALVGEKLKDEKIDVIYASTLTRTQQTAKYIANQHGLNLKIRDDIKEIHGGDWENVCFDELPARWPDDYDNWNYNPHLHTMPNGESTLHLYERMKKAILEIISDNEGKNICIVTHGTAIRTLMCYLLSIPFEKLNEVPWYDNTAVTKFTFDDGKIELLLEGDISHLTKDMSTLYNQEWFDEYNAYIKEKRNNEKK